MKERLIVGKETKRGKFRKVRKWYPNSIIISKEEYELLLEAKEKKEKEDLEQELAELLE